MKRMLMVLCGLIAVSVLAYHMTTRIPSQHPAADEPTDQNAAGSPEREPTVIGGQPTYAPAEPRPEVPVRRVELRREPQQPDETPAQHQWRIEFADHFDRCSAESNLSDYERETVLGIIADAQINLHRLEDELTSALREDVQGRKERLRDFMGDGGPSYREVIKESVIRIEAFLGESRAACWSDVLPRIDVTLFASTPIRITPAAE